MLTQRIGTEGSLAKTKRRSGGSSRSTRLSRVWRWWFVREVPYGLSRETWLWREIVKRSFRGGGGGGENYRIETITKNRTNSHGCSCIWWRTPDDQFRVADLTMDKGGEVIVSNWILTSRQLQKVVTVPDDIVISINPFKHRNSFLSLDRKTETMRKKHVFLLILPFEISVYGPATCGRGT